MGYFLGKVIPALVGLVSVPLFANFLSPEQYGAYTIISVTLALVNALCISWLVSVIIRFNSGKCEAVLFSSFRPYVVKSIFIGVLIYFGAWYTGLVAEINILYLIIGCVLIVVNGYFEYLLGWLRSQSKAGLYSFYSSLRSLIGLMLAIALFIFGFKYGETIMFALAISVICILPLLNRSLVFLSDCESGQDRREIQGGIIRYGIVSAFANLAAIGLTYSDRYLINIFMGIDYVAIYSVNYDLAEKSIFFFNSLVLLSSSVSGFNVFDNKGISEARIYLFKLMQLYLITAIPIGLMFAYVIPEFLKLVTSATYHQGSFIIPIVTFAGILVGIMHRYALILNFYKRNDLILLCTLLALIVNIFCCILMIPTYGLKGAVVSTVFAYIVQLISVIYFSKKFFILPFPSTTLFRVLLSAIFSVIALYAMPGEWGFSGYLDLLLQVFVFACIYIFSLISLKEFDWTYLKNLISGKLL